MSWEGVPERELASPLAGETKREPQQQPTTAVSSAPAPVGLDGEIVENRAIRKLLKDFGRSSSVRKVAEEHMLTGK